MLTTPHPSLLASLSGNSPEQAGALQSPALAQGGGNQDIDFEQYLNAPRKSGAVSQMAFEAELSPDFVMERPDLSKTGKALPNKGEILPQPAGHDVRGDGDVNIYRPDVPAQKLPEAELSVAADQPDAVPSQNQLNVEAIDPRDLTQQQGAVPIEPRAQASRSSQSTPALTNLSLRGVSALDPTLQQVANPQTAHPQASQAILTSTVLPDSALPGAKGRIVPSAPNGKSVVAVSSSQLSLQQGRGSEQDVTQGALESDGAEISARTANNLAQSALSEALTSSQTASQSAPAQINSGQASGLTASLAQASAHSPVQPNTANIATNSAANASLNSPSLDQIVEQIADAREAGRSIRPELTLRHNEFGTVAMRIDANGGDWRATLSARDPAFVPAVQAALAERAIAASSESATAQNNSSQRQDSGTQGQSQQNTHQSQAGFGQAQGGNDQRYGSSTGSEQGTGKPYLGEEGDGSTNKAASDHNDAIASTADPTQSGAVFA